MLFLEDQTSQKKDHFFILLLEKNTFKDLIGLGAFRVTKSLHPLLKKLILLTNKDIKYLSHLLIQKKIQK